MWNSTTVSVQAGSTSSTHDQINEQNIQHQEEDEEEEEEELVQESGGPYQGEFYESDTSNDTGTESMTWISWFCSLSGHEYFAEVAEDFIEDDFNLTGLNSTVPFYKEALEMILDVEPEEESLKVPDVSLVENSAEVLYGMIHQRYILTRQGLQQMVDKYESNHFGHCPRVYCLSTAVVPCGQSDVPGLETVKLFCPNCLDIYTPPSSRYQNIDGAYFGTTFPHLLFQQFPELFPNNQTRIYEPKIFGFKVNERSRSGPRMQWLRMRPNDVDSDEDGDDGEDVEGENDDGEDDESLLDQGGGENNGAPETTNQSGVYETEIIRSYKLGQKSNGGNNEMLGMGVVKEKPQTQKSLVLVSNQSTGEVKTLQDENFGMSPLVKTSYSSTVPPLLSSPSSSSSSLSLQTLNDMLPTESNNNQSNQCEKSALNSVSLVFGKDHNILLGYDG